MYLFDKNSQKTPNESSCVIFNYRFHAIKLCISNRTISKEVYGKMYPSNTELFSGSIKCSRDSELVGDLRRQPSVW